jgi:hypothetical protein
VQRRSSSTFPKTGGTSLRHIVEQVYATRRFVLAYSHAPEDLAAVRDRLREGDVVYGHLFHGIHEFLGVEPRYLTIVLEPIARTISFFRHQARTHCLGEDLGQVSDTCPEVGPGKGHRSAVVRHDRQFPADCNGRGGAE